MKKEETKTCSYEQLSKETGIPKGTLYSLVCQKRIPHYRLGSRHVLFDRYEIKAWLEKYKVSEAGVK